MENTPGNYVYPKYLLHEVEILEVLARIVARIQYDLCYLYTKLAIFKGIFNIFYCAFALQSGGKV